jgi:hypothetical protein
VAKKKTPLLVFGSVLPDISWISESEIGRDQIHYAPKELYEYVARNNPELLDLALGVRLHSNIDKGADYYSDDEKVGFAKVEGRKIENLVAGLVGEEMGAKTLVLAHNFIEAGVDLILKRHNPEILKLYRESVNRINLNEISTSLAGYLDIDKKVVFDEINKFLSFFGPKIYLTEKGLFKNFLILIKQRIGKSVSEIDLKFVIQEAVEIMKNKYNYYLDNAIENMRKDFLAKKL